MTDMVLMMPTAPWVRMVVIGGTVLAGLMVAEWVWKKWKGVRPGPEQVPELRSVNYHFTRKCNYACNFCFHVDKHKEVANDVAPLDQAKQVVAELYRHGMRKINFSGGEPFLRPKWLGAMVEFCKSLDPKLAVSIVSNGSKIKAQWMERYGQFIDILAVSCDSFDDDINTVIGRRPRNKQRSNQTQVLSRVVEMCRAVGVDVKINTVVTANNWEEDACDAIRELQPKRWKVFQALPIEGENSGAGAVRDVSSLLISSQQWDAYVDRHSVLGDVFVPESNDDMRNSYVIVDQSLCFLNNTGGAKVPSRPIPEVGVLAAFASAGFDAQAYDRRGGDYDWLATSSQQTCSTTSSFDIEDLVPDNN